MSLKSGERNGGKKDVDKDMKSERAVDVRLAEDWAAVIDGVAGETVV